MNVRLLFRLCLTLFVVLSVANCSYKVPTKTSPAVNVYSSYDDKIPAKFAVVVDSNCEVQRDVSPSSYVCSAHSYPISTDQCIVTSVVETSRSVFNEVVETSNIPTQQEMQQSNMEGCVYVSLKRFEPSIRFAQKFWGATAIASCDIVLEVKVIDENRKKMLVTTVGANRTVDGEGGIGCGGGSEVLSDAIYQTLRDLMERYAERVSNSYKLRDSVDESQKL